MWTEDHIREVALMTPRFLKMAPKHMARLIFDPKSEEIYQERVQSFEKALEECQKKARDAKAAKAKRSASHSAASDSKRQKKGDKSKHGQQD